MQLHQTILVALLAMLLTACGGSLDGSDTDGDTGDTDDTTSSTSTDTDDSTDENLVLISTRLLDCPDNWGQDISLCSDTTKVSAFNSGIIVVSVTQNDVVLVSEIVEATTSNGVLTPDSALTNSSGIAIFTLTANNDEGAGRVSVTTDAAEQETSDTLNFEIGDSNATITITNDTDGVALAQNSTALITVTLATDDGLYTSPVTVTFSSACMLAETAELDASVTSVNGIARATYQPIGCVGDDVITANADLNSLSATTTVTVASSPADSIRFISAEPTNIAIKGTGGAGRQETSKVLFKVVDQNGIASALQDVEFELTQNPVGATIAPTSATTNADGEVYTIVSAGKVAGTVKVKVKLSDPDLVIATVSSELVISTGLPDQNSFSFSLSDHTPESLAIDDVRVSASILLADHFNNAVPDGTSVYFSTEGGAIRDADTGTVGSCSTVASGCSIEWVSQNPRPDGNKLSDGFSCSTFLFAPDGTGIGPCINTGGMGQPYGGRVTITAYAVGEESFVDNDGDGWFTDGDLLLTDLAEVFYDYNEDSLYKAVNGAEDLEEEFVDFAPIDQQFSASNSKYNGLLCSQESEDLNQCTQNLIHVRGQQILIMASGNQYIRVQDIDLATGIGTDTGSVDLVSNSSVNLKVYLADIYNNQPPSGTVITVTAENGKISGPSTFTVDSGVSLGPYSFEITLMQETEANGDEEGKLYFELKTPNGGTLTYIMTVTDAG